LWQRTDGADIMATGMREHRKTTVAGDAFSAQDAHTASWPGNLRSEWAGFAVSGVVHLAAMGLAALIGVALPFQDDLPMLNSLWSQPDAPAAFAVESLPATELTSLDPGGRTVQSPTTLLRDEPLSAPAVERPLQLSMSPWAVRSATWSVSDLLSPAGTPKASSGQGKGEGEGAGDGQGFFGLSPTLGRKIVYVVDNSRSMNHPHDSEAKTRFRRVKVELINSVWHMGPEQEFYIIFFSNETYPMPASTLQSATPAAKQAYLEWVARMDAVGAPTDPRKALGLALSLKPDIIYFLTDGEFDKIVNRKLTRIKQNRTAIHTFAFGERIGEAVLEEIARNNQGKYTFVP
jgi:hypothetical protein